MFASGRSHLGFGVWQSINYTQSLGRVDPTLREDSEVFVRDQEGFRNKGEYTFNGWRKIDIVLKFIIEPCVNVIV